MRIGAKRLEKGGSKISFVVMTEAISRHRRPVLVFIAVSLLFGVVMTVAVAWGCMYMAQREHSMGDSNLRWLDGSGAWLRLVFNGADGREYHIGPSRNHSSDRAWPAIDEDGAFRWNDFGVEWLAVGQPEIGSGLPFDPERWPFRASADPVDWKLDPIIELPSWASVADQPLRDGGAVIEIASGWPRPAFLVRHVLPSDRFVPHHALVRTTTGAWYGSPFGCESVYQAPYGVMWSGFLINVLAWGGGLAALLVVPSVLRRSARAFWRARRHQCAQCAYDLQQTSATLCSECGWPRGRRERVNWRRLTIAGVVLFALIALAEVVYVVEIRRHPEATLFQRAAFEGDLSTVQGFLDDASFRLRKSRSGSWRGLPGTDAFTAAIMGGQDEVIDLLVERYVTSLPAEGEPLDPVTLSALCGVLMEPEMAARFCERHGLLDSTRWTHPDQSRHSVVGCFSLTTKHNQFLVESIKEDEALHQVLWEPLFRQTLFARRTELVKELLAMPPGELTRAGIEGVGDWLPEFVYSYWAYEEPTPSEFKQRLTVAREIIERVRVRDSENAGAWHTVVTAGAVRGAIYIDDHEARAALFQLYEQAGLIPQPDQRDMIETWLATNANRFGQDDRHSDWESLIRIGFDVNAFDPVSGDGPPLLLDVELQTTAYVQFLLEHGAIVTDLILDVADEENRALMEAWLESNGKSVVPHRDAFPRRAKAKPENE